MTPPAPPDPLRVGPAAGLDGRLAVPGDKSISHRVLFCGALARGVTRVTGWLPSEDCHASRGAVEALGARVEWDGADGLTIHGSGRLACADDLTIDCGNSGTSMRLLLGLIAGQAIPHAITLVGDASLSQRPMERVLTPLRGMGAVAESTDGHAPVVVRGAPLHAGSYHSPVASAQVKSAILFAGLTAEGTTTVIEPAPSRDHTERMLRAFGVPVRVDGPVVSVDGPATLTATDVRVPGDISSAAFVLCAAAGRPGWRVTVTNCGCNPSRSGVLDVLEAMGCTVEGRPETDDGVGEPMAAITVTGPDSLRAAEIAGPLIPRLIDELPVLAVLATQAHGRTTIRDAAELRVKESDRIATVVDALAACGVSINGTADGFEIDGPQPVHGGTVHAGGDHRLAMSMAVAGLWADGPIAVHDTACIATSFPGFADTVRALAPGSVA